MKYSLFIGRYQPFHKGHKTIIETVLKEGGNVCVAVMDTKKSKRNPYSAPYRIRLIQKSLKKWEERVKIITIPQIRDVCFGRKVGWGIREIKCPRLIEVISGTNIRKKYADR
jgi:cytidyltransferase-like protein